MYSRVCARQERALILRHFYTRETVYARTVRATVIFTEITGWAVRKIVTAKDFEFSPRKGSAAESTPSFLCMCMHYACTVALREKCLGSKARGGVALSLFISLFLSLSPFLFACYQFCIGCAGVRVSIPGIQMRATLLAALIVLVRFFNNDIPCHRTRCQEVARKTRISDRARRAILCKTSRINRDKAYYKFNNNNNNNIELLKFNFLFLHGSSDEFN